MTLQGWKGLWLAENGGPGGILNAGTLGSAQDAVGESEIVYIDGPAIQLRGDKNVVYGGAGVFTGAGDWADIRWLIRHDNLTHNDFIFGWDINPNRGGYIYQNVGAGDMTSRFTVGGDYALVGGMPIPEQGEWLYWRVVRDATVPESRVYSKPFDPTKDPWEEIDSDDGWTFHNSKVTNGVAEKIDEWPGTDFALGFSNFFATSGNGLPGPIRAVRVRSETGPDLDLKPSDIAAAETDATAIGPWTVARGTDTSVGTTTIIPKGAVLRGGAGNVATVYMTVPAPNGEFDLAADEDVIVAACLIPSIDGPYWGSIFQSNAANAVPYISIFRRTSGSLASVFKLTINDGTNGAEGSASPIPAYEQMMVFVGWLDRSEGKVFHRIYDSNGDVFADAEHANGGLLGAIVSANTEATMLKLMWSSLSAFGFHSGVDLDLSDTRLDEIARWLLDRHDVIETGSPLLMAAGAVLEQDGGTGP